MTYNELVDLARKDILDPEEVDLDRASLKIPSIVQKWSEILYHEELALYKQQKTYIRTKKIMWEFYNGKMCEEDLKKYGLDQFPYKVLKKDIDVYMNADERLLSIDNDVTMQSKKVSFVERKLKEVGGRQWNIRAAIDYRKFLSGA